MIVSTAIPFATGKNLALEDPLKDLLHSDYERFKKAPPWQGKTMMENTADILPRTTEEWAVAIFHVPYRELGRKFNWRRINAEAAIQQLFDKRIIGRVERDDLLKKPTEEKRRLAVEETQRAARQAAEDAYINFRNLKGTPAEVVEAAIRHMMGNLLFLYDKMPKEWRERAKKWYDGANKLAHHFAKRHGIEPEQAAGVMASLSPQKDWFMNVSLGERVMDIMANKQDYVWDAAMTKKAKEIFGAPQYRISVAKAKGKKLSDLYDKKLDPDDALLVRALWLRVYDEAINPYHYRVIAPEGDIGEFVTKKNGENRKIAWGSLAEISGAISIFEDGSRENISRQLGEQHKVRNFFNNIIDPDSEHPFTTGDTHAVAANTLRPLAISDVEVKHAQGAGVSNAKVGIKGTYPIHVEPYRRVADQIADRDGDRYKPREVQSITWEAIRGLFPDWWKKKPGNKRAVADIWREYNEGRIDENEARERIFKLRGQIDPPAWTRRSSDDRVWDSTYKDELAGVRVPNRRAKGVVAGTGKPASRGPSGRRAAASGPGRLGGRGRVAEKQVLSLEEAKKAVRKLQGVE
jgi:hypothetical protein